MEIVLQLEEIISQQALIGRKHNAQMVHIQELIAQVIFTLVTIIVAFIKILVPVELVLVQAFSGVAIKNGSKFRSLIH